MSVAVTRSLDFGGVSRALNLPDGASAQEPATVNQLNTLLEGLAWKDNVRAAAPGNVNIAAPGATIDGLTASVGERYLLPNQTAGAENGIYIWNGAATPMTRSLDCSTFAELKNATVTVDEGTSAGSSFRQSVVTGTLGVTALSWGPFGSTAPAATTGSAGVAALATQGEVDAGAVTNKIVTPATLAASVWAARKFATNIGDGSATSYTVTHNLNTRDVRVEVYRNSGNFDTVLAEVQRTSVNAVAILFDAAPAANAYRVLILA